MIQILLSETKKHISSRFSSNSEVLSDNHEEMFPRYDMHNDVFIGRMVQLLRRKTSCL